MKADINVTPLIDVLLVLLIIFMVVVPAAPRGLDAALPRSHDRDEPASASLVLELRAEDYALNRTPVFTLDELEGRLRAALETRRGADLFVRCAPDVGYARLVAALDMAKAAGAVRIGLVEESESRAKRIGKRTSSGSKPR